MKSFAAEGNCDPMSEPTCDPLAPDLAPEEIAAFADFARRVLDVQERRGWGAVQLPEGWAVINLPLHHDMLYDRYPTLLAAWSAMVAADRRLTQAEKGGST